MHVKTHFQRVAHAFFSILPRLTFTAVAGFPALAGASDPPISTTRPSPAALDGSNPADWPMWGGRPDRNMASDQMGLPAQWDIKSRQNLRWVADLGSQTYGNPVVSGGKVFIGTNNAAPRDASTEGDRGVLMCLAESDGHFLWQAVHEKLKPMESHDWPEVGLCSVPCVMGDRLYYVSNRGELICLDTEGFLDGENDGPMTNEVSQQKTDADFVWKLDMIRELSVSPHFASASSPVVMGDWVFVVTGNGVDDEREKVPAPDAPSFVAVNRLTGKLVWSDHSPGDRILDGQWSAPACGSVNGQPQVVFPGGDGWLYAFEPASGKPIWKFDCDQYLPADVAADRKARNYLVATPVFHDNRVFIAVGQAPDNGDGPGCVWAVDASKSGDITKTGVVWKYDDPGFHRSISTLAIGDGLLYAAETRGFLHCLDASTGKPLWKYDLNAPIWSSPLIADGKVYIANEDGDVVVLAHGREMKLLAKNNMRETVHATVVPANGSLYIADRTHLSAITEQAPTSKPTASAPATRAAAEWPMFRGNSQLTGTTRAALTGNLRVRWKYRTEDTVESSAAIAGGAAYVGSNDGYLHCLDLAQGSARWKFKAGGPVKSSPCVHGNLVFAGDSSGIFHAIEIDTGHEKWSLATEGEIISSANCTGGRVLFGSYDGNLYCLDEATGKQLWKFETEGRVHGTPGVAGDKVLVAGCDEQLRVVKLEDGSAAGAVSMDSYSGASAAISGANVFVGTFGNQVLSIDWTAPRVRWAFAAAEGEFPFYSSAAIGQDVIVIGGRDKLVHALDQANGKEKWSFATQGRVDSSPVIAGSRVFVGSADGTLYALNLADGKRTWQFDAGASIWASPAVADCLVIGTEDGTVYCFEASPAAHENTVRR